ncbi:hypothetical protein ABK040_002157 [Willaertia magna]
MSTTTTTRFNELPEEILIQILSYLLFDINDNTNYFIVEELNFNNQVDNNNDIDNDNEINDRTASFEKMENIIKNLNYLKDLISFSLINKNIYSLFKNLQQSNETKNYFLNLFNIIFKFYNSIKSSELYNCYLIYGDLPNNYYIPLLELKNILLNKERGTFVNVHNELQDCRQNYNEEDFKEYFFNLNDKNFIKNNFLERIKKLKFTENEILKLKDYCNVTILDLIILFYLKLHFLNNSEFTMDTNNLISFTNNFNSLKKLYFPIYGFSFDGEESLIYFKNNLNEHLNNYNKIFYLKFINIFNLNNFTKELSTNNISILEFDFISNINSKINFNIEFCNVKSLKINFINEIKNQNILLNNLLQKENFPKLIDLTITGFTENYFLLQQNNLLKQLISIQISNSKYNEGIKFKPIDFLNSLQQLQQNNEIYLLKNFTAGLNVNLLNGEYYDDCYEDEGILHNVNDLQELYELKNNVVFSVKSSSVCCRSQLYFE